MSWPNNDTNHWYDTYFHRYFISGFYFLEMWLLSKRVLCTWVQLYKNNRKWVITRLFSSKRNVPLAREINMFLFSLVSNHILLLVVTTHHSLLVLRWQNWTNSGFTFSPTVVFILLGVLNVILVSMLSSHSSSLKTLEEWKR